MYEMKELHEVIFRNIQVKMLDGSLIHGKVNVPDSSLRTSDWFKNYDHPFIVVVSEESQENDPEIFIINKTHISWVKTRD
jgi:hypothetical protein